MFGNNIAVNDYVASRSTSQHRADLKRAADAYRLLKLVRNGRKKRVSPAKAG